MKKIALVFVLAVFVPSLVLAWLAVRSLRDQQLRLERQQSLLCQSIADAKAKDMQEALAAGQRAFQGRLVRILDQRPALEAARSFDTFIRQEWPLAQVGFCVSLKGEILSPPPSGRAAAAEFWRQNSRFLANRESAEVYWNNNLGQQQVLVANAAPPIEQSPDFSKRAGSKVQLRNVIPQQQTPIAANNGSADNGQNSRLAAANGEFSQLIGEDRQGVLARFVDNKLSVLFWERPERQPDLVFGAQLALPELVAQLRPVVNGLEASLRDEFCLALLDDNAKPVVLSHPQFRAAWKHPFVATEISEALPHWEVAIYLLDPGRLARSAQAAQWTLGLLIAILVLAIGVGGWLIVGDLNRELTLARQKTDFVSNVSHELKTPLTSIRMFAELLAEGRVTDPEKQRAYLGIITAEAGRLTRLINNVLDFARLERGEKKYQFGPCDLSGLAGETAAAYRPHLETGGFRLDCELSPTPLVVHGDPDALAQVLVNLLSNAEKYGGERKEITVRTSLQTSPLPYAEVQVLDRGLGVPPGCEEKIFEKFYRAHDSLSNGVQGSGLGLTIARQIARAHGGDVTCAAREGGGSRFSLRLPVARG